MVQSSPVRSTSDAQQYTVSLWLPYAAIPQMPGVATYEIEAQVQLLRRDGTAATLLTRMTTTFRVYGPARAADEAQSPPVGEFPPADAGAPDG